MKSKGMSLCISFQINQLQVPLNYNLQNLNLSEQSIVRNCYCYFYFALSAPTSRRKRQMTKIPLGNFWNLFKKISSRLCYAVKTHFLLSPTFYIYIYTIVQITNISKNLELLNSIMIIKPDSFRRKSETLNHRVIFSVFGN